MPWSRSVMSPTPTPATIGSTRSATGPRPTPSTRGDPSRRSAPCVRPPSVARSPRPTGSSSRSPSRSTTRCAERPLGSLLVVLHDRFRAHLCRVGVLPRVAPRAALTKQVPTLVQGDLDGPQLVGVLRREPLTDVRLFEAVLLIGESTDLLDDLAVVHTDSFRPRSVRMGSTGTEFTRIGFTRACLISFDRRRSASGLPPVWQVGQYCSDRVADHTSRMRSPHTGHGSPVRPWTRKARFLSPFSSEAAEPTARPSASPSTWTTAS